jgi:ABC-2 type transport system permease protein
MTALMPLAVANAKSVARDRTAMFLTVLTPLLFIFLFGTLFSDGTDGSSEGGLSYLVPSILAMSLMQLGIYGALPLVQQREKLILKRLATTPLSPLAFIGAHAVVRLALGVLQAVLLIAVGIAVFGVVVVGHLAVVLSLVLLGVATFTAIGYVVATFAATEETATLVTNVITFPLMFLSGVFFPIAQMPDFLQPVAVALPLTYLADALRQVMVASEAFAPLVVEVGVLGGWLAAALLISARQFRWQ